MNINEMKKGLTAAQIKTRTLCLWNPMAIIELERLENGDSQAKKISALKKEINRLNRVIRSLQDR